MWIVHYRSRGLRSVGPWTGHKPLQSLDLLPRVLLSAAQKTCPRWVAESWGHFQEMLGDGTNATTVLCSSSWNVGSYMQLRGLIGWTELL